MDSSDRTIHVWYPTNGTSTFPLIAYAHGLGGGGIAAPVGYSQLMTAMAEFGYIVTLHGACNLGCDDVPRGWPGYYRQQLEVLSWAKRMAGSGDAVMRRVNLDIGFGIAGHSMGGQSTLYSSSFLNASSNNIRCAVMHHPFTDAYPAASVPALFLTGTADTIAPASMARNAFNAPGINPIRGFANKQGATHYGPIFLGYDPLIAQFTAAWFKLFLDKIPRDQFVDYDSLIFGSGSSLCTGAYGTVAECTVRRG
jgi:pimeloyl-ACP methyl ester carboxylesterase